jgi:uncharacterized protein YndB with AHSA1/START domain
MAHNCTEVSAPLATVFEYLLDPSTYPRWLIGAEGMDSVDDHWPRPGSRFYHKVGVGPLRVHDHTEVLELHAPHLLRLSVHASTLVRGEVTFHLRGDERSTILCLQEEPEKRLIGNLLRPVLDPLTHVRNHRSLARFARLVADEVSQLR